MYSPKVAYDRYLDMYIYLQLVYNYVFLLTVSCYQLQAPDNGKMECTGNHYEDVCTFSCDDSYELTGSDSRTCQSDAAWSGSETECVPGWYTYVVCVHVPLIC